MDMASIVSIQVGRVRTYEHGDAADGRRREWRTAFWKTNVSGSVRVGEMGLEGDEQADREDHGGLDKAVLAYSAGHYAYWREHLKLSEMEYGGFGENLTVEGS